jgi:holo-[acyl-carrier protein] synthase
MILGIGTDIASIERFRNSRVELDKFASKILTDYEQQEYNKSEFKENFLAKRWAAKEAISKAWGTGISSTTKWKSIEVRHNQLGAPFICFYNELNDAITTLDAKCHLSISDEGDTVIAYSIIEYSQ